MKITVAQRAIGPGGSFAKTIDEVTCGIGALWVEIDGHRTDEVRSVMLRMATDRDDETGGSRHEVTCPTIEFFANVEIVYIDGDGNELGRREGSTPDATIRHGTTVPRVDR